MAADTGIDAEAKAEANADLEQIADQDNENSQTATPTVAFTASPTLDRVLLQHRCRVQAVLCGRRRDRRRDRRRRG